VTAFSDLLQSRKEDYGTWVPVFCGAINDYVFFNAMGFNHLRFRTDNTPRNPKEAMYKLGLLPLVRTVIHNAGVVKKYERRMAPVGGSRKKTFKEIEYWAIEEIVGKQNTRVRVIIRRIGNGRIHFWSVMKYE
jgi:hypothetical protein